MKLKTKIQLFVSVMMIVSIALVNTVIYIVFMNISQKIEMDHLTAQVNTIVQTMNTNRDIPSEDLLRSFLPENGMIRLINEEEEVVTTITRDQAYRDLPVRFVESEQSEWVKGERNYRFGVVYKPYIDNDGHLLTVELSTHFVELEETMQTLLYILLGASIIMLIPSIVASSLLTRFILRPIQQLIEAMRESEKKIGWQKIKLSDRSKDELYEMGKTYNKMMNTLQKSYEKQEMFVSDASHELKTPLAIIQSYAQLMKRHGKDPEITEEAIEAIASESVRMQQLVEQMLVLARSAETKAFTSVSLSEIIDASVHRFQDIATKQIIWERHKRPATILGDKDQLTQVIYILLDNAIKYGGDVITVQLNERHGEQHISVHDNGKGIPADALQHLFDRFYRVDDARARKDGGTGLGLAIAKEIVEHHHGSLTVTSDAANGTTFLMTIPQRV